MSDIKILKHGVPVRFVQASEAPENPENGMIYYDTSSGFFKVYENGSWQILSSRDYADSRHTRLDVKETCRVATTANVSGTYANGTSGVGATITGSGALGSIDGITLSIGNRVLVLNQTSALQNGIYRVTALNPYVLTRATDFDSASEVNGGEYVLVREGTRNAASAFICSNSSSPTFGTTAITFTQYTSPARTLQQHYSVGGQINTGSGRNVIIAGTEKLDVQTDGGLEITNALTAGATLVTTASVNTLAAGNGAFRAGSDGDIARIRNVTTSFPTSASMANHALANNGSGTLSFANLAVSNFNDVSLTSLSDKNFLRYESSSGRWRNLEAQIEADRGTNSAAISPVPFWYTLNFPSGYTNDPATGGSVQDANRNLTSVGAQFLPTTTSYHFGPVTITGQGAIFPAATSATTPKSQDFKLTFTVNPALLHPSTSNSTGFDIGRFGLFGLTGTTGSQIDTAFFYSVSFQRKDPGFNSYNVYHKFNSIIRGSGVTVGSGIHSVVIERKTDILSFKINDTQLHNAYSGAIATQGWVPGWGGTSATTTATLDAATYSIGSIGLPATVNIIQTDASGVISESMLRYNLNLGNNVLSGVATPTVSTDIANKGYVDSLTLQSLYNLDADGDDATITTTTTDGSLVIAGTEKLQVTAASGVNVSQLLTVSGSMASGSLIAGNGSMSISSSGDLSQIQGISYSFPSSQAAGPTYTLANDGSGSLTWIDLATASMSDATITNVSNGHIIRFDGSKFANESPGVGGDAIAATTGSGYLDSSILQYNIDFIGNNLSNIAEPVGSTDIVTKSYFDRENTGDSFGTSSLTLTKVYMQSSVSGASVLTLNSSEGSLQIVGTDALKIASGKGFMLADADDASKASMTLYKHGLSLLANQTDVALSGLTFNATLYQGCMIEYKMKDADGSSRVGTILVSTNGAQTSISDTFVETAPLGVTWGSIIADNNVEILYTSNGSAKVMDAKIKFFS